MARSSLKSVCRLIESATQTLPVEKEFLGELKRSIELTEDKNAKKPSQTYKPSGMRCLRGMYYQIIGQEPDKSSSNYCMIGIAQSGTDRHVRIQDAVSAMKDNGIDCEYIDVAEYVKSRNLDYLDIIERKGNETKLYHKELNISFLCDGIIRYKGKYYIIEFKTETLYKWQSRTYVDSAHYDQAVAYSLALKLNDVLFIYICRDNCDMKAYMFTVTDEMRQALIDKIHLCDDYVNKNETPPKPTDIPKKACEYCAYKEACKADG